MNAHRRFALAAAAPALENLGTIAVLGVVAVLYAKVGDQPRFRSHCCCCLASARPARCCSTRACSGGAPPGDRPRADAGWRDPQVRASSGGRCRRRPGRAGGVQLCALLVVANRGPAAWWPSSWRRTSTSCRSRRDAGGALADAATLPARRAARPGPLRDTYLRGLAFASFIVMPAAVGLRRARPADGRTRSGRVPRRQRRPRTDGGLAAAGWRRGSWVRPFRGHLVRLLCAQGHDG